MDAGNGVVPVERPGLDAVDLLDEVAALDTRAPGGRALDGRDHDETALALLQVDADADDLGIALRLLLELGVLLGIHETGMRIQHLGQATRSTVHQLGLGDVFHVVVFDVGQHLGEHPELVVRVEASGR